MTQRRIATNRQRVFCAVEDYRIRFNYYHGAVRLLAGASVLFSSRGLFAQLM